MRLENSPTWMCVVAVALARADGRWLMHQRPAGKQHAGLWEFPGGKVELGEVPVFAMIREASEELGIALSTDQLSPVAFAESDAPAPAHPIVILLYKASQWVGEPAALEGGAVGWFTPREIAGLPRPPLDIMLSAALFEDCAQ